jgi:hypothetical protein
VHREHSSRVVQVDANLRRSKQEDEMNMTRIYRAVAAIGVVLASGGALQGCAVYPLPLVAPRADVQVDIGGGYYRPYYGRPYYGPRYYPPPPPPPRYWRRY